MAYNPISGFTLQVIAQSGEVASDYYLKFYEANTTTPLSMATDSTGGTLLVKAKLSDSGFPISNPLDNSTVFIPHMNANYRLVVYLNETDADANDTASAYVNIPFVSTMVGASAIGTVAALDTGTAAGEVPTNADLPTVLASYIGRKNLIINGDFSVWQRGTASVTASGYAADRWLLNLSGATSSFDQGTFTLGQTDVPGNPEFYAAHDTTVGNNFAVIKQRIERVALIANREVTLSFWAKGVNPGGGFIGTRIAQNFGTGGSPSTEASVTINEDFALTASWQRFTVTFTPPSISGKTLGTDGNDYLEILIGQITDTSVDAWNIDLANVQLEFGDTATEFEYVSPADQLARCQRYFERFIENSFLAVGHCETTGQYQGVATYKVEKRAIPSINFSTQTGFSVLKAGANSTPTAMASSITSIGSTLIVATAPTLVAGEGASCVVNAGNYVDVDAEL